ESDLALTESHGFVGTPYYMAPEQIRRDPNVPVDQRADVWGLGVTMYETLALRRPFQAQSAEELFAEIRYADPEPLRRLNPGVSRELEAVVQKALERDPARRYQDMAALAADLQAALEGRPVTAQPVSAIQHIVSTARRHRVPTGVAILGSFTLAASLIGVWALFSGPSADPTRGGSTASGGGATPSTPGDVEARNGPSPSPESRPPAAPLSESAPAPLAPPAARLPKGVAFVLRVFEDPANPARPKTQVLPALWFGPDPAAGPDARGSAVFPPDAAETLPPGFNERFHGQLVWVLPEPSAPLALNDPRTYASGAGRSSKLERLAPALGAATVEAIKASDAYGMIAPSVRNRWIVYELQTPGGGDGVSRAAADAMEINKPVKASFICADLDAANPLRLEELYSDAGNLVRARLGGYKSNFSPAVRDASGVVLDKDSAVLGYMHRGFFTPVGDLAPAR
ncbi:MAG TPA: protein kinase, partial [Planctomycetota bacterium]|nr:protein kinase [Planctomycetota bacterium]